MRISSCEIVCLYSIVTFCWPSLKLRLSCSISLFFYLKLLFSLSISCDIRAILFSYSINFLFISSLFPDSYLILSSYLLIIVLWSLLDLCSKSAISLCKDSFSLTFDLSTPFSRSISCDS